MDSSNPTNASASAPPPRRPVMDVLPPKPADVPKAVPKDDTLSINETAAQTPARPTVVKPPKPNRVSSSLAIVATVLIVLGLAAMFVYAYLRTQNVAPF